MNKLKPILWLSSAGYIAASVILFLVAIWILVASAINLFIEIQASKFEIYQLLDEVALVVFAFAVIDVSKFLLLEEVLRSEVDRKPKQARRALRKLVLIIFTALSLEGLVLTIEMAKTDIQKLVYPILLILVTTLYLIGMGFYQLMSSRAEKE